MKRQVISSSDDEDDRKLKPQKVTKEGLSEDQQGKKKPTFGQSYLTKLGHKEGEPLREGGDTETYRPAVTGGFSSTVGASVRKVVFQVGDAVVVNKTGKVGKATRCDAAAKKVEVLFPPSSGTVSDSKATLLFADLRLANEKEAHRLELDIGRAVDGNAAGENGRRKRGREDNEEQKGSGAFAGPAWIVPGIMVRIVDEASEFFAKKGVVASLGEEEDGCITVQLSEPNTGTSTSSVPISASKVDTVIPKNGEHGIVVAGFLRGSSVTVVEKIKSGDGGSEKKIRVKICLPGQTTEQLVDMAPEEVTALP